MTQDMTSVAPEASQPSATLPAHDLAVADDQATFGIDERRAHRLVQRASLLAEQGDRAAAVLACRQAIALLPDHAPAYSLLGMLLEHAGDFESAIKAYEKLLLLKPDSSLERASLEHLCQIRDQQRAAPSAGADETGTDEHAVDKTSADADPARDESVSTPRRSPLSTARFPVARVSAVAIGVLALLMLLGWRLRMASLNSDDVSNATPTVQIPRQDVNSNQFSVPDGGTTTGDTAEARVPNDEQKSDNVQTSSPSRPIVGRSPAATTSRPLTGQPKPASRRVQNAIPPDRSRVNSVPPAGSVAAPATGLAASDTGGASPGGKPFKVGPSAPAYIRPEKIPYEPPAPLPPSSPGVITD